MSLTAGSHLGPYEILAAIGEGGMGKVYRAHIHGLDDPGGVRALAMELVEGGDLSQRSHGELRSVLLRASSCPSCRRGPGRTPCEH